MKKYIALEKVELLKNLVMNKTNPDIFEITSKRTGKDSKRQIIPLPVLKNICMI